MTRDPTHRFHALMGLVFLVFLILVAYAATTYKPAKAASDASLTTPQATPTPAQTDYSPAANLGLGIRTKTSGCVAAGALQDKACTPGAIFNVTSAQVCQSGYASSVRDVPQSEKDQVYAEYGIRSHTPGQYEVDHLISLELGGSNAISNLWPEPAEPIPGFHQKDQVEDSLHHLVCSGQMTLEQAQVEISTNWLGVYNGTYKAPGPSSAVTTPQTPLPSTSPQAGVVKLSATGICHAPGDPSYAQTTHYTAYQDLNACLASGGRLPK